MYTTYASSELYEFIIVIVISSNVVTRFWSPQLRCRLHKKLVAVDAKGVSAGAHISLLLHLSNPVTLTTNETLRTWILFGLVATKNGWRYSKRSKWVSQSATSLMYEEKPHCHKMWHSKITNYSLRFLVPAAFPPYQIIATPNWWLLLSHFTSSPWYALFQMFIKSTFSLRLSLQCQSTVAILCNIIQNSAIKLNK